MTSRKSDIATTVVYVFAAIAMLKFVLLIYLGPISTKDTFDYVDYAHRLLASTDWLYDGGLASAARPPLLFRAIGYPMVLAITMRIGGSSWPYLVIASQFFMSFAAAWAVYHTAMVLGLKRWISLTGAAAYMLSLPILLDQCLQTDSLHASLVVLAVCLLASNVQTEHALRFKTAAIAGVLLALAFMIREPLQFLVISVVPLLVVSAWLAGRAAWWRSALGCGLVLLPLALAIGAYESWNFYRTGMRFVSTSAQVNIPLALAIVSVSDPIVIAGDTPFDRIARENFKFRPLEPDHAYRFADAMFKAGYNAVDQSKLAYENFFLNWRRHPIAMLEILRSNVNVQMAKLTFRPFMTVCSALATAREINPITSSQCYGYRFLIQNLRSQFSGLPWTAPINFVLQTLEQVLAIMLFSGFILGIPILVVWRKIYAPEEVDSSWWIVASFWLMYLIWFISIGVVHNMEERYLMPVLPASIVGGLFYWQHVFARSSRPNLARAQDIN